MGKNLINTMKELVSIWKKNKEIVKCLSNKHDDIILGLIEGKSNDKTTTHTIIDFKADSKEEMQRLCRRVCDTINNLKNGNIRFQYNYNRKTGIGRFIFKGDWNSISKVVILFE